MTRKVNIVLLIFLAFVAAPFAWLMLNASTRGDDLKPVSLPLLRDLAARPPGERPVEVRYETIGRRWVVSDLLAAGSGLRPVPFVVRAYVVVMSDGALVTIDRGMSREAAQRARLSDFDPRAQWAVDRAVAAARMRLTLSAEQRRSGRDDSPYAVAPGIVVVPVPDVAAGERMIYVRLDDDRELLFTGNVAPIHAAWMQGRPPARLVTRFLAPADREEIGAWLRTINAWKVAAPQLQIVAGHDSVVPRMLKHGFGSSHDAWR